MGLNQETRYILQNLVKNIQKYTDLTEIYTLHKCKYTKYTLLTRLFSEHRNIQICLQIIQKVNVPIHMSTVRGKCPLQRQTQSSGPLET